LGGDGNLGIKEGYKEGGQKVSMPKQRLRARRIYRGNSDNKKPASKGEPGADRPARWKNKRGFKGGSLKSESGGATVMRGT